jgi:hypothetical protein
VLSICKYSAAQNSCLKKPDIENDRKREREFEEADSLYRLFVVYSSYERKNFISGTGNMVPYGRTKST